MFDAGRLRVFRAVVEAGSLSAAAEALSFTQPAVSRQIATLEREAGAQLLERTARGIRLTEAGRVLLEHADAILDRLAAAQAQVESVARLEGGRGRGLRARRRNGEGEGRGGGRHGGQGHEAFHAARCSRRRHTRRAVPLNVSFWPRGVGSRM